MWVLATNGDQDIWASVTVILARFKDPELGFTREEAHLWLKQLSILITMIGGLN
jgi:hypothetical protein